MARTVLDRSDAVLALAGVFRRRGFEASSLSVIQQETGIGRGSLYHFFPQGKTDMARAVLEEVRAWFEEEVFKPLRTADDVGGVGGVSGAVATASRAVTEYFTARERVCLFAAVTLGEEEAFAGPVRGYFTDWVEALATALRAGGTPPAEADERALDAVAAIQGGLVLARAYGDDATFLGIVARAEERLLAPSR